MFKEWLKQFIAVCICIITLISPISQAYAESYVENDKSGDATYYIISGKDVDELFDFGISDVDNIVSWMFQFKTYTVIKKYTDVDGSTQYKMYFNTPNLQSIVKNRVISLINDGYTDDTYKIEDTEWVVPVGTNATTETVFSKYGFAVPSYTYMGEYPKEVMSTAGILPSPKKWWQVLWRAVKAIFGASFIKAPDADNFNTITYLNHTYKGKDDYILEFFKKYYLDYFERQIPTHYIYADDDKKEGDYFENAEEVISMMVTDDVKKAAESWNNSHESEYEDAVVMQQAWDLYQSGGAQAVLDSGLKIQGMDMWHYLASRNRYATMINAWIQAHPQWAYILCNCIDESRSLGGLGIGGISSPADYGITPDSYSGNDELGYGASWAADVQRYAEDDLHVQYDYDVEVRTRTVTRKSSITHHHLANGSDSTSTIPDHNEYGDWSDWSNQSTEHVDDAMYTETESWRDDPTHAEYQGTTEGTHSASSSKEDPSGTHSDGDSWTTWTEVTWTETQTRHVNFNNLELWDGKDNSYTMPYDDYKDFVDNYSIVGFDFEETDIYPSDYQNIYKTYNENADLIDRWNKFQDMLKRGDDQDSSTSKKEILYRQCMITNEGEDEECWSKKYGDEKTSLTMVNVYALSGIYQVTQDYDASEHTLKDQDAHEIIAKLQAYCGPYYPMVLANMMKLMCATAKYEGVNDPTVNVIKDDKRVMPYDTATLLARDRENYAVTDPRVNIYKSHIVGKLVSDFQLSLAIGIYIKPQKTIIGFAGKVTEMSVFMQQLCNFDVLDGYGLSPASMWQNSFVMLLIEFLAIFFIIKTVLAVLKMGSKATGRILIGFLLLVFELGVITAIHANPEGTWKIVKNVNQKVINLGEMSTLYSDKNLTYLFGDPPAFESMYYLPYLDTWAKYNTGYGLLKDEQLIDSTKDYRELPDVYMPKISGTEVKHWCVMLMDSFSYWGDSNSIANTIVENGHTYNGVVINNNAYRVVDHFMAPRVKITDNGGTIDIKVTENENYNGEFQTGFIGVIVKLLNCCLCCFLSLIKLLTFLYLWWQLYIFIFKVILGKAAENKTWGRILAETFSPLLALVFIGFYSGVVMTLGMQAPDSGTAGVFGIVLEIFLFWLTFILIRWWHDLGQQKYFPVTLGWVYFLTNLSAHNRYRAQEKIKNESRQHAAAAGMPEGYEDMSLEEQRQELFEDSGVLKAKYRDQGGDRDAVVRDWYRRANFDKNNGKHMLSPEVQRSMAYLENDEKYKGMTENVRSTRTFEKIKETKNKVDNKIEDVKDTAGAAAHAAKEDIDTISNAKHDKHPGDKDYEPEDNREREKTGDGPDTHSEESHKIGKNDDTPTKSTKYEKPTKIGQKKSDEAGTSSTNNEKGDTDNGNEEDE